MLYRYKTGAAMSADLKRAARAVRDAVDAKPIGKDEHGRPVNPRLQRLCQITADAGQSYQLPDMEPRSRHRTSMSRWANYGESVRARESFGWYLGGMVDRNDSANRRGKAA